MRLQTVLGTPYLPASQSVRLVGLLVTISDIPTFSLPLRLLVVVDKSESMMLPMVTQEQLEALKRRGVLRQTVRDGVTVWEYSGAYAPELENAPRGVDFVKDALRQVVERLTDSDEFALIAFASRSQTVITLSSGNKRREIIRQLSNLETLELGTETRMSLGLKEAIAQIQMMPTDGIVNRIVVLTDGFAQDESDCHMVASQASSLGVSISTIGLGAQFNDELMTSLADRTGGNAEWVPDPTQIPQAMAREFEQARKVGAPQAQILIQLSQGVEVRRAYKIQPVLAPAPAQVVSERTVALQLGDLVSGQNAQVLVELLAPPRPEGTFRLARLNSQWRTKAGWQQGSPVDIVVTYTSELSKTTFVDPQVARAMEMVTASELQTRALRDLQAGQVGSATKKLEAAATRLLNLGEREKAQETIKLAQNLKQGEQVSPEQTKRLRYQTRRLQ
ncbi:MAG: VWA domain-containing protein [Armatimonadetes bacterium]|nr:VWA domain-containing protein [Armatimonadota bacterium]MDW8029853.1 VWA domain-containing protein [Armatimonadota bacterium]